MISLGSRDGRKGLGLRFGVGGEMEENELEEGEACCYPNNDDSTIDPDVALSYIDEKLQDVLGHFQKDFEGGVSAENLGAKYGGYGSFLPTYQRSPAWPHPRSPPKVHNYNVPTSPNNPNVEGGRQNSVFSSNTSQLTRIGPASVSVASLPALRDPSMNGKVNQEVSISSARSVEESNSNGQFAKNNSNASDQKTLKVRIKVGSDNLSTRKNSEIYSGLGLDDSPSSSLEGSPTDSDGFFREPQDTPDESPTSILQMMTSFPVHGGLLLSPLPYDLLYLTEKEKWEDCSSGHLHKGSQESTVICVNGSDSGRVERKVSREKKLKPSEKISVSVESSNGNGVVMKKETEIDNLACEELVSNALRLPLLSNTNCNALDLANATAKEDEIIAAAINSVLKDESSDLVKEESLEPVFTRQDSQVGRPNEKDGSVGKVWEANKANSDEDHPGYPVKGGNFRAEHIDVSTKADLDVSKGSKTLNTELIDPQKLKAAQKSASLEKDIMKLAPGKETSSSGGKKKSKGSQSQGSQSTEVSNGSLKNDSSSFSASKNRKSTYGNGYGSRSEVEGIKKHNGKGREKYRDFFGELDLDQEDSEMALEEKPSGDRLKDSALLEKGMKSNGASKERLNRKKNHKPSSLVDATVGSHVAPLGRIEPGPGLGPASDAAAAAPIVEEHWVCCDKCQKWRLLPYGANPKNLPEKWLCSKLTWLDGMNRCSISEEETTKLTISLYPGPAPVSQHVHPGGTQAGVISADALHFHQKHQDLGTSAPPAGIKKKHGLKDVTNETKQDGPTLSSNSAKKNLQTSFRSRSFNGGNQSPTMNGIEFQDSGQSSSLIADKHKQKQKEKNKLSEKFMDGDNTQHSKIRNKRETGQDSSRASKKIKTEDKHYTDEDRVSDQGGTVLKVSCNSTSGLSVSASGKDRRQYNDHTKDSKFDSKNTVRNPENHNQITSYDGYFHMGNCDDGDVMMKRKLNEYMETHIYNDSLPEPGHLLHESRDYAEETSENDHRKEKKARVSKSEGEVTGGADKRGRSMKDEQLGSLDVIDSKGDVVPVQASVAATSSSSKVSGSHKTKVNLQEVKGSPVESVSSSPLRISNLEKFAIASPKKCSDGEDDRGSFRSRTVKKDESQERDLDHASGNNKVKIQIVPSPEFATCYVAGVDVDTLAQGTQYSSRPGTSNQGHNEERWNGDHDNGSRPRKNGKGSSSRSKDKSRSSRSDFDKVNPKIPDPINEHVDVTPYEEKSKAGRNKFQDKLSFSSDKVEKSSASKKESSGKLSGESAKRDGQSKHGHHDASDVKVDAISSQDTKQNLPTDRVGERSSKRFPSDKTDRTDVTARGKSHSLPPSGRSQNETERLPIPISGSQKENAVNTLSGDTFEGDAALKVPKHNKKAENQNGNLPMNVKHPTPNRNKVRDHDAPSPLRRDSSSQAATNAVKEAKDLKHLADRLKNSGSSSESTGLYFQAALKFLHGASLLETCNSESGKHGDMMQWMTMYSSTAKLCEFCAHEYEKSKEMAAAALAYKCTEVAYLKVISSSHTSASKDRHELQSSLQIGLTGESPSSSASDLDNLNNPATLDKVGLSKGVSSPQVAGNHVIAARNRPNFVRLLNFAQDVNFAMEASRRSRIAFAAASSKLEDAHHREGISSVKKALDFNFQDVEGLLRLVKLAMEVISR